MLAQQRERVESWIADAEGEEEYALQVLAAADKLRTKVGKLSKREQVDLIEMLDIQVTLLDCGRGIPRLPPPPPRMSRRRLAPWATGARGPPRAGDWGGQAVRNGDS